VKRHARQALRYTDVMAESGRDVIEPDPVIEAYKKDIDRTLLRENLRHTPDERLRRLDDFMRAMRELRGAARRKA
jgi:hypothetical protein